MKVKTKITGASRHIPGFTGPREVPVDFPGDSLGELIRHLLSGMDSETKGVFLNERGEISPDLFVVLNGIAVSSSNRFNLRLKEGDLIELVSSPG